MKHSGSISWALARPFILLLGLALLGAATLAAQQAGPKAAGQPANSPGPVRLVYADDYSLVTVRDAAGASRPAGPDLELGEGWSIATGKTAAELAGPGGRTAIRLAPGTSFAIRPPAAAGAKANPEREDYSLLAGKVRILAAKSTSGAVSLTVRTPLAVGGVRGTDFVLAAKPGDTDWICVRTGLVEFTRLSTSQTIKVAAGQYADATYRDFAPRQASQATIDEIFAGMDLVSRP